MLEYAKIHKDNGTEYAAALKRILQTNSARTFFAADVGYHRRECYMNFTGDSWKQGFEEKKKEPMGDISQENFLVLVEAHVIVREEVYTLTQLRKSYDDLKDNQSLYIDIKGMLIKRFGKRIKFGKPPESVKTTSEYVYSASIDFAPATIHSVATGNDLEISVMLKKCCSRDIQ